MERNCRDLEGKAGEHEHHAEQRAGREVRIECCPDTVIARRAGETVDEADAVKDDTRGETTQDEVLQAGFAGLVVTPREAREDVGREARQLETDIQRHQVNGGHHDAHAGCIEQHQHGEFTAELPTILEVARGHDQAADGCDVDERFREDAESIDFQKATECRSAYAIIREREVEDQGAEKRGNRSDGDRACRRTGRPGGGEQKDQASNRKPDFRTGQVERVRVGHQCSPSDPCSAAM